MVNSEQYPLPLVLTNGRKKKLDSRMVKMVGWLEGLMGVVQIGNGLVVNGRVLKSLMLRAYSMVLEHGKRAEIVNCQSSNCK